MNNRSFNLWLIDSNPACLEHYQSFLSSRYKVRCFNDVEEAFSLYCKGKRPDLIITEALFDRESIKGPFNAYLWREMNRTTLWVVSEVNDIDSIRSFYQSGIKEFFTKPINCNEFMVKIEQFFINTVLDEDLHRSRLSFDGIEVDGLTLKQSQILTLFLQAPERSLERKEIESFLWRRTQVHPKTINVHMHNIRKKLKTYGYDIAFDGQRKWYLIERDHMGGSAALSLRFAHQKML